MSLVLKQFAENPKIPKTKKELVDGMVNSETFEDLTKGLDATVGPKEQMAYEILESMLSCLLEKHQIKVEGENFRLDTNGKLQLLGLDSVEQKMYKLNFTYDQARAVEQTLKLFNFPERSYRNNNRSKMDMVSFFLDNKMVTEKEIPPYMKEFLGDAKMYEIIKEGECPLSEDYLDAMLVAKYKENENER